MAKRIALLFAIVSIVPFCLSGQKEDPVLFTVDNAPVHLSEFTYIYAKTNGKNADFSRKSLDEYLDLYVKFKLKVRRAKDMRLDTIPQLSRELEGYRRQLADSYLIDKEVTEELLKEAYERIKQDVDISHVLILLKPDNTPADTLEAYQKALNAKKRLESGEDWAVVAQEVSEDNSAKRNGGHIGFVTAPFPNGFYALETAAYSQPPGKISDPVRTNAGYHILKVHSRRPARGEIEAAHILVRKNEQEPKAVKARIDSIYQALQKGADFETLAREVSEDRASAEKGGYVGIFGISRYERSFEDAAFSLKNDGDYSQPFESSAGLHIVKRITKKDIQPYQIEKSRLETKIRKDPRFEEAKTAMIERIKRDNNLRENRPVLEGFIQSLTDTFLTFKWKAPEEKSTKTLFTLGKDYVATLGDFTDYLGRSTSKRLRMSRETSLAVVVNSLYDEFLNENLLKFEETQLEKKYPDFKALMREYEEGILLFEATKMLVWDKASQDSVGLNEFYKKIEGKYRWRERAETTIYRTSMANKDKIGEIREFARNHSKDEVLAKFNTNENIILTAEEKTFEKDRNPELAGMEWQTAALSQTEEVPRNQILKFIKIENILPEGIKTLQEARGYIVADYQDYLEQLWVEELRKEYKVKINKDVFEGIVKGN
jgi:peptidyl-prolyl cis-trans isomerase SurA